MTIKRNAPPTPASLQVFRQSPQKKTIPYATLKNKKALSHDVNKDKLEDYLSTDEFIKVLGVTKKEFDAMPAWKQNAKKREAGLF